MAKAQATSSGVIPGVRRAMILAAGKGTRLRPLTLERPKPMLPLAGKPLIQHQIEALAAAGIEEVVINLHYLGDQISAHLGTGATYGLRITYSEEDELLETGGGIVHALPLLGDQPFLLLNGDIWTDFAFSALPSPLPSPGLAHLVLTPTPGYRAHGDFNFADGRITARGEDYVYCGMAVLHPELFKDHITTHFSLRDIYFDLIERQALTAQIHTGQWHDIGTVEQYEELANQIA